jgi:hypothetical protein
MYITRILIIDLIRTVSAYVIYANISTHVTHGVSISFFINRYLIFLYYFVELNYWKSFQYFIISNTYDLIVLTNISYMLRRILVTGWMYIPLSNVLHLLPLFISPKIFLFYILFAVVSGMKSLPLVLSQCVMPLFRLLMRLPLFLSIFDVIVYHLLHYLPSCPQLLSLFLCIWS